jgi:putative regulator of septum formation
VSRRTTSVLAAATVALVLAGCSDDQPEKPSPSASSSSASPSASASAAVTPPTPADGACYLLDYTAAIAPTSAADPVPCRQRHTSTTYAVGALDAVVDGHLLAVDSQEVRDQVAQSCPERFRKFVGGTPDDRRLSMLRPVWFTPTVEQSDAGASWYRCDLVALAADERLAPLTEHLKGVLGRATGRDHYGMCGTAAPGTTGFKRVICSSGHTWRAVATVPFDDGRYPGVAKVRAAGTETCKAAGAAAADGSLDYKWGYEWPTAEQWQGGRRYGICWAPD